METSKRYASLTTITRKMVIILLAVILTVPAAIANGGDTATTDENAAVYCLRVENEQVFFVVKLDNLAGEKFDVLINDAFGENLYRGTFADKNFNRVFRAPSENGKLIVIIKDAKSKTTQRFEITSEAKIVQQAYVKRM
jgi:hypothetical protein